MWGYLFFLSVTDVLPISEVQTSVDIDVVADTEKILKEVLERLGLREDVASLEEWIRRSAATPIAALPTTTDPYMQQCLPQLHKLDSDSLDAIVLCSPCISFNPFEVRRGR